MPTERSKPMSFKQFTTGVRQGNGYLKAVYENDHKKPVPDSVIRAWYEAYLREGGWKL